MSFMSSSNSSSDSIEIIPEHNMNMEYPTLTPVGKGSNGRKGLFSRGKHSIGKIINKAGRIGGFRQKPSYSIDGETVQTEYDAPGLELKGSKESASHDKLPAMSEPSMLLSETMRTVLYTSLPVLVQGRNWMLVYRLELLQPNMSRSLSYWLYSWLSTIYFDNCAVPGDMEYLYLLCIEGACFVQATHFWCVHTFFLYSFYYLSLHEAQSLCFCLFRCIL